MFILHLFSNSGWMSKTAYNWAHKGCNVCGVNWNQLSSELVLYNNIASSSVPFVAEYLKRFILALKGNGAAVSSMHMAGHSLGAHVAGQAGRKLLANGDRLDTIYGSKELYVYH